MAEDEMTEINNSKRIREFLLGAIIIGGIVMLLKCFGNPHKEGFFCEDRTIRYPYKPSTISSEALYFYCLAGPVILMGTYHYTRGESTTSTTVVYGHNVPAWFQAVAVEVAEYLFGAACCELFTMSAKYTVGRLRPHFIDTCDPFPNCVKFGNNFVKPEDYSCRGKDSGKILDSRTSFPSGHSSLSAYAAVYLGIYFQVKLNENDSILVKRFLQFLLLTLSWVTGLSRVTDYKHHWSDVASGLVIGIISGLINALVVSSLFNKPYSKEIVSKPEKSTSK